MVLMVADLRAVRLACVAARQARTTSPPAPSHHPSPSLVELTVCDPVDECHPFVSAEDQGWSVWAYRVS